MKYVGLIIGVLVSLILAGSALANPGRSAYVLRYDRAGDNWREYLVRFDVENDDVLEEIKLPGDSGYNNFVVDERGGCYISKYRTSWDYGQDIYYYNPPKKRIEHFIDLRNIFGPRHMVLTRDELIAEVKGNDETRLKSGLVFIDRKKRKIIDTIFIHENDKNYIKANINDVYFDGHTNIFFTSFYVENEKDPRKASEKEGVGDILVVDVKSKRIIKVIKVPRDYLTVDGICDVGDKIYVAALSKGKWTLDGTAEANTELLVFSLTKGALLKKIKISGHPYKLAYDPSVNKLYVQHMDDRKPRSDVEIIDTTTDKVIGKLTIPSQLMFSVVKPGKMYITVGENFLTPAHTKPALLVLDTKTDKIIKRIYGDYKGISVNTLN